MTPETKTGIQIDKKLIDAGHIVQDMKEFNLTACILKQQCFVPVSEDFVDTDDFKQHIDYQSNLCINISDYIVNKDYSNTNV